MFKGILKYVSFIILGFLGGFLFETLFLPLLLTQSWIDEWPLFKNLSRNVVNYPIQRIVVQEGDSLKVAIKQSKDTLVVVGRKNEKNGVGFALTSDGMLALDSSLVPGTKGAIFIDGESINFSLEAKDSAKGISIIKLENRQLKTTSLVSLDKLEVGEKVFVLKKNLAPSLSVVPAEQNLNEIKIIFEEVTNEGIVKKKLKDSFETNIVEDKTFGINPVFNFKGEFLGMSFTNSKGFLDVISADYIRLMTEKKQ